MRVCERVGKPLSTRTTCTPELWLWQVIKNLPFAKRFQRPQILNQIHSKSGFQIRKLRLAELLHCEHRNPKDSQSHFVKVMHSTVHVWRQAHTRLWFPHQKNPNWVWENQALMGKVNVWFWSRSDVDLAQDYGLILAKAVSECDKFTSELGKICVEFGCLSKCWPGLKFQQVYKGGIWYVFICSEISLMVWCW